MTYKVYEADLQDDFKEDPRNANKGTERGHKLLEQSVEKFGAARSMVADADGYIPAGNKTREALIAAGIRNAVVVETDGNTPVIVKRTDWKLTDGGNVAREYAYADNRIAEIDLQWDQAVFAEDVAVGIIEFVPWFSDAAIDEILGTVETEGADLPELGAGEKATFCQKTFTFHDEQAEEVDRAIKRAKELGLGESDLNENSNGNAIYEICRAFIEGNS